MAHPDEPETDSEVEVVPNPVDGVISGEARPPDEHTRRVEAASRRRRPADTTQTMQKAWDQEQLRAASQTNQTSQTSQTTEAAGQSAATEKRPSPPRTFRSGRETGGGQLFGPPRAPNKPKEEVAVRAPRGPEPLPDPSAAVREVAQRIAPEESGASETRAPAPQKASDRDERPPSMPEPMPTETREPESSGSGGGGGGSGGTGGGSGSSPTMSTREYADRSIRERRRERDRRAEKTALRWVVGVFILLGAGGYFLINSELIQGPEEPRDQIAKKTPKDAEEIKAQKLELKPKGRTSSFDETPDIPALRALTSEGLTIAAEGIPEVLTGDQTGAGSLAAATETCRLAYGVWEFSPNKRFRFLTTCGAFEGQTLVGAYEVQGSTVRMSPLIDGGVEIQSEFEVEKPSRMRSAIRVTQGEKSVVLTVNQRVTSIRGGLEGEAFRDTFAPKNTLALPGQRKGAQEGGAQEHKPAKDPLLDLIKKR